MVSQLVGVSLDQYLLSTVLVHEESSKTKYYIIFIVLVLEKYSFYEQWR